MTGLGLAAVPTVSSARSLGEVYVADVDGHFARSKATEATSVSVGIAEVRRAVGRRREHEN
jgi:hypothetical protein